MYISVLFSSTCLMYCLCITKPFSQDKVHTYIVQTCTLGKERERGGGREGGRKEEMEDGWRDGGKEGGRDNQMEAKLIKSLMHLPIKQGGPPCLRYVYAQHVCSSGNTAYVHVCTCMYIRTCTYLLQSLLLLRVGLGGEAPVDVLRQLRHPQQLHSSAHERQGQHVGHEERSVARQENTPV